LISGLGSMGMMAHAIRGRLPPSQWRVASCTVIRRPAGQGQRSGRI